MIKLNDSQRDKDIILIREKLNGKQEVISYITKDYSNEKKQEQINKIVESYPKDIILVCQLIGVLKK